MTSNLQVQEALMAGNVAGAIAESKAAIRKAPTDADLRFLLFQLLSVAGDWAGAANQLAAQRKLLNAESPFITLMEGLVRAEVLREQIFRGEIAPKILGEPPPWIAPLVQALRQAATGKAAEAQELRAEALEAAPASGGTLDDTQFAWLMDGDSRLGPIIEVIMNGSYYWVPQGRIRSLQFQPPEQPRDMVWTVAQVTLETGVELPVFLPARYPGAAAWENDDLRLARATEWNSPVENYFAGRGQKIWMTEAAEYPALNVRKLAFVPSPPLA